MKRTLTTTLLVVLIAATSFARQASAEKVGYNYDFQKTLGQWSGRIAIGDAVKSLPLQLGQGVKGNMYAALTNPGAEAVWMQAKFPVSAANTLDMSFDVMNVKGGERLAPIVCVKRGAPGNVYEFQKLGLPLEKGSQHLSYQVSLKDLSGNDDSVVVAIGFMDLDSMKTYQVAGIDNVNVTIFNR